jgi:hypothetical protein
MAALEASLAAVKGESSGNGSGKDTKDSKDGKDAKASSGSKKKAAKT